MGFFESRIRITSKNHAQNPYLNGSGLPEGDSRLTQQFAAGLESAIAQVPEGRMNPPAVLRQQSHP